MSTGTIDQIATKAGVSRATVARILNTDIQYHRPAYANRAKRIRQIARQMGYVPNAAAKAISTGRFNNIALVMGTHYERSNFTREMIRGIHDALAAHDVHLTITFLPDEQLEDADQLPKFLRQQMVDGLLINYTHAIPPHMQQAIERAELPVVWVNVKREQACVYPDDLGAGRSATRHLIDLGHRRIAFADLTHGPDNPFLALYSAVDRLAGYREAMASAGLEPLVAGVASQVHGRAAVEYALTVLQHEDWPTALVCQSARDAVIFESALSRLGGWVPDNLSMVVFGPQRMNDMNHEMTRLVEPREAMGRAAASALLRQIDKPGRPLSAAAIPYALEAGATARPCNESSSNHGSN